MCLGSSLAFFVLVVVVLFFAFVFFVVFLVVLFFDTGFFVVVDAFWDVEDAFFIVDFFFVDVDALDVVVEELTAAFEFKVLVNVRVAPPTSDNESMLVRWFGKGWLNDLPLKMHLLMLWIQSIKVESRTYVHGL